MWNNGFGVVVRDEWLLGLGWVEEDGVDDIREGMHRGKGRIYTA